jgi:hypothetical protein
MRSDVGLQDLTPLCMLCVGCGLGFEALASFMGTFGYLDRSMTTPELNAFMQG